MVNFMVGGWLLPCEGFVTGQAPDHGAGAEGRVEEDTVVKPGVVGFSRHQLFEGYVASGGGLDGEVSARGDLIDRGEGHAIL
jgi:hypothetical protein